MKVIGHTDMGLDHRPHSSLEHSLGDLSDHVPFRADRPSCAWCYISLSAALSSLLVDLVLLSSAPCLGNIIQLPSWVARMNAPHCCAKYLANIV